MLREKLIEWCRSAQWQTRGFCLRKELLEGWGAVSLDLVELMRAAALDKRCVLPRVVELGGSCTALSIKLCTALSNL